MPALLKQIGPLKAGFNRFQSEVASRLKPLTKAFPVGTDLKGELENLKLSIKTGLFDLKKYITSDLELEIQSGLDSLKKEVLEDLMQLRQVLLSGNIVGETHAALKKH